MMPGSDNRQVIDNPEAWGDVTALARDGDGRRVVGDPERRQPVFSVTKMFLAVAVLRLAESGVLGLDDEVHRWLPQTAEKISAEKITVREVLSHTAGLPDYAAIASYAAAVAARPGQPGDLDEILAAALAGDRPCRGAFRYSNVGYWILGAVTERATGRSLGETLEAMVFGPAAMASTSYPQAGAGVTSDGYDTRWAGPAGAAWSTAADLDLFLAALFGGTLIAAGSLAAMTCCGPVEAHPPWRRPGYGLGLMVDSELGTFGHGGSGPGYNIAAFTGPASGRSAVVLARSSAPADPTGLALRWLAA